MRRRAAPATGLLALAVLVTPVAGGCEAVGPIVEPSRFTFVARDVAFVPAQIRLPAGVPLEVTLRNADPGVPHGLRLAPMRSGVEAPVLLETELVTGPGERAFPLPPLEPGPYLFTCPVHPIMLIEGDAR